MKYTRIVVMLVLILIAIGVSGTARADTQEDLWLASWYGPGFQGNDMANTCPFDMHNPATVAHKTLPFGTILRLINPLNSSSIDVEVRDRGPYHGDRKLDLSRAGAEQIGMIENGTAKLEVILLYQPDENVWPTSCRT